MNKKHTVILVVLTLVVVLLVGINSRRFFVRLDVTENKVYSISAVSKNLFLEIPEQVSITYYVSDRLRRVSPVPQAIEDLLYEYAAFSRGSIVVDVIDPALQETTVEVEALGIQPQQIQVVEQNEQSFAMVYSGLVIRYLDRYQTLPIVFDITTVEYDLTAGIRDLVREDERVAGVVIGDERTTLDGDYGYVRQILSERFVVRQVARGERIPGDVDVLLVIGSRDFTEYDVYPLDQYIMGGGTALFAVESATINLQTGLQPDPEAEQPLLDMLESYGVRVGEELVLDENNLRIPLREQRGNMTIQTYDPYPYWIAVADGNVDHDHPITARFSGLDLFWAAPLYPERGSTTGTDPSLRDDAPGDTSTADDASAEDPRVAETGTPQEGAAAITTLASTGSRAWLQGRPFVTSPTQSYAFTSTRDQTQGRYDLAVALTGPLDGHFVDRDPPAPPEETEGIAWDPEAKLDFAENARFVVVGDAEFMGPLIETTRSGFNLTFLRNAVEWLANEADLLEIRTRSQRYTGLDAIADPAARRASEVFAQGINIYLVPLGVALFGLIRFLRRRERGATGGGAGGGESATAPAPTDDATATDSEGGES